MADADVSFQSPDFGKGIVGQSPAMQQVYKIVLQVAPTNATVLITGESGTGKELIARAIYQHSKRNQKHFIAINCAAIPENLLESELFGHEKGSFTGAHIQRVGKFEQCDGGTLFLDEIGDMPLRTQTKILRVLQEGDISRVGSNASIHTDVRIIAATNKELWQAVQRKEFREDLFYRLNVVRIQLPNLRERMTDLPILVSYFIEKFRSQNPHGPTQISEEAMTVLERYPWPGNVRELENCIQRAMVLSTGEIMTPASLPTEVSRWNQLATGTPSTLIKKTAPEAKPTLDQAIDALFAHARSDPKSKLLPSVEKELIMRALAETDGNQVKAAQLLGITRATLRKRVDKFGIQKRTEVR